MFTKSSLTFCGLLLLILFGACRDASPPPAAPPQRKGKSVEALRAAFPVADAPSWPQFHGPKGDNISPETGLLKAWPTEGPPLVWKVTGIGNGYSSVSLSGGLIYAAGNVDSDTVISAVDLDGNVLWQVTNGEAWTDDYPGARGTPTVDAGRLYHESPLGQVVCLDAVTGEGIWHVNILGEFNAEVIRWGLAESLLVDGSRVICCPGGDEASVVALDRETGETVWAAKGTGDPAGYASPALAECDGLRIVLAMTGEALVGVNAENGELLFRHEHPTQHDVNATSPICHDGRVFISSGYRSGSELLKIHVDGQQATVEPVWQVKQLDNHHGGVVLLEGYLYGSSAGGKWMCLEWSTGRVMYAEPGVGKGSLTCADGMLYTLSENRRVGLVEATPTGHTVVSQFELPSGGEGKSWAHPVVCGGRLYLRHGETLFAYDVRGP
ncbi:MAG: PQQ-binding-like beta-propeller repeat protein [Planctomycetota bacterium]|jgi:outer membrane protein assembly factor BamB